MIKSIYTKGPYFPESIKEYCNKNIRYSIFKSAFLILIICMNSCEEDPVLPTVTTNNPADITRTEVTCGGVISDDGGSPILGKGVCYGTTPNPDFTRNFTADGEGSDSFTTRLKDLTPNTVYYVRAYATNCLGTAYGSEISFTTAPIIIGTLITYLPTSISRTTAISGGDITLDGGGNITQRGVCWSTTPFPEITDSHTNYTNDGTGTGKFESTLTSLSPGTRYYLRAYAINIVGVAYGEQFDFHTKIGDIQGNLYNTVTIGKQIWMTESLRTTKFNNNTAIPNITTPSGWVNLKGPGYCWYDNDIAYKPSFGALYSWYTVNSSKLCPTGWHVPSNAEFDTLEVYLGVDPAQVNVWGWRGTDQGTQLKSTTGWDNGGNGTNSSGFDGLAGGYLFAGNGYCFSINILTYWWTATEHDADRGWYRRLDGTHSDIYKASTSKNGGKYVRCIKN